jgi:hypothetical protein
VSAACASACTAPAPTPGKPSPGPCSKTWEPRESSPTASQPPPRTAPSTSRDDRDAPTATNYKPPQSRSPTNASPNGTSPFPRTRLKPSLPTYTNASSEAKARAGARGAANQCRPAHAPTRDTTTTRAGKPHGEPGSGHDPPRASASRTVQGRTPGGAESSSLQYRQRGGRILHRAKTSARPVSAVADSRIRGGAEEPAFAGRRALPESTWRIRAGSPFRNQESRRSRGWPCSNWSNSSLSSSASEATASRGKALARPSHRDPSYCLPA